MKKNESMVTKKSGITDHTKPPIKYNQAKTNIMHYQEFPVLGKIKTFLIHMYTV